MILRYKSGNKYEIIPTLCIYANDQAMSLLLYKRKTKQKKKGSSFFNYHIQLYSTVAQENSVREAMDLSYSTRYPAVTGCEQSKVQNSLPRFTEQLTYLYSSGR